MISLKLCLLDSPPHSQLFHWSMQAVASKVQEESVTIAYSKLEQWKKDRLAQLPEDAYKGLPYAEACAWNLWLDKLLRNGWGVSAPCAANWTEERALIDLPHPKAVGSAYQLVVAPA
jgi:hypothetical protein